MTVPPSPPSRDLPCSLALMDHLPDIKPATSGSWESGEWDARMRREQQSPAPALSLIGARFTQRAQGAMTRLLSIFAPERRETAAALAVITLILQIMAFRVA